MLTLFCCTSIAPYRPQRLYHEAQFTDFVSWAAYLKEVAVIVAETATALDTVNVLRVVQLVRHITYGPLESKSYFCATKGKHEEAFVDIEEKILFEKNFVKLDT
jgi:hypothetical protein